MYLQKIWAANILAGLLLTGSVLQTVTAGFANTELAYLQSLHLSSPTVDPTMTAMLLGAYLNARETESGIDFFHDLSLQSSGQDANRYRAAMAVLRAAHAENVFLLKRPGWVKETIKIFDEVRAASPDDLLIRWMTGTALAQLPGFFKQQEKAKSDLQWLLQRLDQIPLDGLGAGMEREVFYQLACIYRDEGQTGKADEFLQLSGYRTFAREAMVVSQFAASAEHGLTMAKPEVQEVVPGKVFSASGYEMTEFYFVVSADNKQTISIDMGSRPDSAQRAHTAVLKKFPELPPIKTVLVTHAHWDHIGGHGYFLKLEPALQIISRDNYAQTLELVKNSVPVFKYFFSDRYTSDNVVEYQPNRTVGEVTELNIGGTRVTAVPIPGGETRDGIFYHFPDYQLTFVGDFIMPYIGAPFVNEGDPAGLLDAIDILSSLDSKVQLHGHKPLTAYFAPVSLLQSLKSELEWLSAEVSKATIRGLSLADIQQLNLIPAGVYDQPALQLPYFIIREGFISRLHEQSTGYWKNNLDGMDYLSHKDIGNLLSGYLNISETNINDAMQRLLNEGHHDAALKLSNWGLHSFPESEQLQEYRRKALLGLRGKYQFANPFKFLIYSESLGEGVTQLAAE